VSPSSSVGISTLKYQIPFCSMFLLQFNGDKLMTMPLALCSQWAGAYCLLCCLQLVGGRPPNPPLCNSTQSFNIHRDLWPMCVVCVSNYTSYFHTHIYISIYLSTFQHTQDLWPCVCVCVCVKSSLSHYVHFFQYSYIPMYIILHHYSSLIIIYINQSVYYYIQYFSSLIFHLCLARLL
jgi:hypothetical protein